MAKIIKHFSKLTFPFCYDKTPCADRKIFAERQAKNSKVRIWKNSCVRGRELRSGLEDLFCESGSTAKIAECFSLNPDCRGVLGLPPLKKYDNKKEFDKNACVRLAARSGKEYCISIDDIDIFLFESGVGLLSIEFNYLSDSLEDYTECNFYLTEVYAADNRLIIPESGYDKETKQKTLENKEVRLIDLVSGCLSYVEGASDFDGAETPSFKNNKAVLYSYVLLDKNPDNLGSFLFNARRNFKSSYKMPPKEYSLPNQNVYQPFENSFWAASNSAVVNASVLTDDDATNNFFKNGFVDSVKETYYFLFLNTVHQKFAVRHLLSRMGTLDRIVKDKVIMQSQQQKAEEYRREATALKFRAFFDAPTNIEHINQYFKNISAAFEIPALLSNFNNDIDSLIKMCEQYVRDKDNYEKLETDMHKAKLEIFISIAGAVVACITLLNSSWALLEKLFDKALSIFSLPVLVLLGAMLLPIVSIIISVKNKSIDIKKMKEDKDKYKHL